MTAMLAVLRRELGSYFNTAIGYVILITFLGLTCYLYVNNLFVQSVADMRGYFSSLPLLMIFFVPGIAMRLWAEERKLGTLELLMTYPLKTWQAVLGKYLAGTLFLAIMMGLTLHIPIMLEFLSPAKSAGPDWGPIIGGYLGAMVLGMVYLAVGSFASSLTSDQIIALVVGILICFALYFIGIPDIVSGLKEISPELAYRVQQMSVLYHFESITRGVVDTRDIVYAITLSGFFLFLNILIIDRRR